MEALTYSTVAVTMGLVVARPRISARFRVTPALAALAGVAVLALVGSVRFADVSWAAATMWRPLLGIVSIMLMTGVARRLGVLDRVAEIVFERAGGSPQALFASVFLFGAVTASVLNNDSAILLVTPLVVAAAKKRSAKLVEPLAFVVFLSAGIAPLVVSNPMNMVVASYAHIGFNEYAMRMALPAAAGALVTFAVARFLFRKVLATTELTAPPSTPAPPKKLGASQWIALGLLGGVVGSYPVVSYFGGPVWVVAFAGAVVLMGLAWATRAKPITIMRDEVHLDTLVFLLAAFILSIGLRHVGVVDRLAQLYAGASTTKIGILSAVGSAVLNNHPMSHLNMFALGDASADHTRVLAALVGGDVGPRLFPMGSLAGLLWMEMLRREGVTVSVRRFVAIGAAATLPALAAALALL